MTDRQFNTIVHRAVARIRGNTPRRTGNLRDNATKLESRGADRFVIFVDTNVAPYFRYVNNEEIIRREFKKGKMTLYKHNRNYKYWEKSVDLAINDIAQTLGGRIER